MKFGGTSVGKPERMHQVSQLITKDSEPTIVVLSALSGTTNSLVGISDALAKLDKQGAITIIDTLEKHYRSFIIDLLKSDELRAKANAIIDEHYRCKSILNRMFINAVEESKNFGCKYVFGLAIKSAARNHKIVLHRAGYDLKILLTHPWPKQKNHGYETRYPCVASL